MYQSYGYEYYVKVVLSLETNHIKQLFKPNPSYRK